MSMVQTGLIFKWYKDYMSKQSKFDKSLSAIDHNQAKLETMKGPFAALSVGLIVATFVFVLEIYATNLKNIINRVSHIRI